MRRGLGAPGAPDERRRKPGTNRACVLLLGRNRHESDLFVQQGRHWEPLSTHAEHRLRFRWVTSFFTCEFSLTPSLLSFSFFHFLPVTLHLSRPPILWLVPPFLKQRIVPTIHAINRIENFKLKSSRRDIQIFSRYVPNFKDQNIFRFSEIGNRVTEGEEKKITRIPVSLIENRG